MASRVLVLLLLLTGATYAVDWDVETPLDTYVNSFDPYYEFYEMETIDRPGYTVHVLNMTSQKWFDEEWSLEPYWWHYLNIFVPKNPKIFDAGYLAIGGGNQGDDNPDVDSGVMFRTGNFCQTLGIVSAYLRTVPFQPIHFVGTNLTGPRVEDSIIGYTWAQYIEAEGEPDPDWVVLLPMTKAAKHALDTVQNFVHTKYTGYAIEKFMPTGFSKRGWVTWLLGCVDRRVFAMAPTVFDLLNFQDNLEHHYRALGGWSWAFLPYWIEDVSKYLYHPRVPELASFIDPFSFNERLTMPKLLIASAGDQFFPPDGSHYFWDKLTGPKLFRICENDDHSMGNHLDERDENLQAFFLTVYNDAPLPVITWTRTESETDGEIIVTTSETATQIHGWWTNTTDVVCEQEEDGERICRRDFRLQALPPDGQTGIEWFWTEVTQIGPDQYSLVMDKRKDLGFSAFFIELRYVNAWGYTQVYSTEVHIIPDFFPYPKCETEEECRGRIV